MARPSKKKYTAPKNTTSFPRNVANADASLEEERLFINTWLLIEETDDRESDNRRARMGRTFETYGASTMTATAEELINYATVSPPSANNVRRYIWAKVGTQNAPKDITELEGSLAKTEQQLCSFITLAKEHWSMVSGTGWDPSVRFLPSNSTTISEYKKNLNRDEALLNRGTWFEKGMQIADTPQRAVKTNKALAGVSSNAVAGSSSQPAPLPPSPPEQTPSSKRSRASESSTDSEPTPPSRMSMPQGITYPPTVTEDESHM